MTRIFTCADRVCCANNYEEACILLHAPAGAQLWDITEGVLALRGDGGPVRANLFEAYNDALAMLDEARAQIEAVKSGGVVWQDIKSAPRDGTVIDLWADDKRWTDCHWTGANWFTPYGIYNCGAEMELHGHHPSHWMPLPPPPIPNNKGE
jgi:hypothetical protein